MEYIKNTIEYPIYKSRAFELYFGGMEVGVLDIETTGLSPKNSAFVLGGLASPVPADARVNPGSAGGSNPDAGNDPASPASDTLIAEQYFAENLSEESQTLHAFWQASTEKDVLITFNGQHFDIPFIKERLKKYEAETTAQLTIDSIFIESGITAGTIDGLSSASGSLITDSDADHNTAAAAPMPFHLDLFLLVKNFSPIKKFLPNLKQKSIENYMGLWQYRKDEISGAESVELYYQFLTERQAEARKNAAAMTANASTAAKLNSASVAMTVKSSDATKHKILLHNHDDIVQLYRLLKVIEKCDLHRSLFTMGFPVKAGDTMLVVEKIALKNGHLKISGRQNRGALEYQCYDYNGNMCYMHFNKNAGTFTIELPLIEQAGLVLIDLEALDMAGSPLNKYPACQEGFLILRSGDNINYLETNHFIKLFTERMIEQWITNR